MKLYWPEGPTGSLPSLWTFADYPIVDDVSFGMKARIEQLSDNKPLPYYALLSQPVAGYPQPTIQRKTLSFTGAITVSAPAAVARDLGWQQTAVFGVPLATAGTVTRAAVFPAQFLGTSGNFTMSYGSATIQALALFPAYIYVYRPSTSSVVGIVSQMNVPDDTWLIPTTSMNNYTRPNGTAGTGPGTGWKAWLSETTKTNYWAHADVDAEAGDVVCYEMWHCSVTANRIGSVSWVADYMLDINPPTSVLYPYDSWAEAYNSATFFAWNDLASDLGPFPDGPSCPPTEVLTGSAQSCNAFAAPTGGTATES
jgi:hypothetical protein